MQCNNSLPLLVRSVGASRLSEVLSQLLHVGGASPAHPGVPPERVPQVSRLQQGVHQRRPAGKAQGHTHWNQALQL